MTEYIKREDVMERVGRWQLNTREAIAEMIMSVPSADVVERKRGEWDKDSNMAFYWKCSECGAYLFWRYEEFMVNGNPHYCPNCGADMRHSDD